MLPQNAKHWDIRGKMDITLFYREKGNGEPFVLLHGNGEDSSYFKHQIEYFCDRYRVIAPDTRGHGKSPRGTSPFTIRQFSCDLYDFMKNHQIPKRSTQLPIEIGYKIAKHFAKRSAEANKNAELLGLMVNDPNIEPEELAQITAPTLVICGTKDMIREDHTRKIAENIPNARLAILEGDHFVANKRSEEFNREVDRFLESL